MSLELLKQQAQAIIDLTYKKEEKKKILEIVKAMKKTLEEERKQYV